MSAVVLRCPHCGTTRSSPGDCEACHEAEVRYYCTNHKPGVWLDTPACPQCGARFGDPTPPRPTTPGRTPRAPAPSPPPPPSRRAPPSPPPPMPGPIAGPWGRAPGGARRGRLPEFEDDGPESLDPRARGERGYGAAGRRPDAVDPFERLREILHTASRGRRRPWGGAPVPPPVPRLRLPLVGCLFRLLLLLLLMMFLGVGGMFMLLGGGLVEFLGGGW